MTPAAGDAEAHRLARLVDAEANRAREGLRVAEDVARFLLSDDALTAELRAQRHRVTDAVRLLPFGASDLVAARDAGADVGYGASFGQGRGDLRALVAANLHRVQESLRVLEECARLLAAPDPARPAERADAAAQAFERARYAAYDLERRFLLALASSPEAARVDPLPAGRRERVRAFLAARLYVVTDRRLSRGRSEEEVVRAAIAGGAGAIQLRAKEGSRREILATAKRLRAICSEHGVLFVVNDRPGIAVLSGADGLHVGQDDVSVSDLRRILPPDRIVGVSTHSLEQARQAESEGADYIAVGPVYETRTKGDAGAPVGTRLVREAADGVRVPFVAIGGIREDNAAEVVAAGADRVAVVSAAVSADDVTEACRRLRAEVEAARALREAPRVPAAPLTLPT